MAAWTYTPYTTGLSTTTVAQSASDRLTATTAWNVFERVEAQDAATRSTLLGGGATVPPSADWYSFRGAGEWRAYRDGQYMHALAIPSTDWTSQRFLPLTNTQTAGLEPLGWSIEPPSNVNPPGAQQASDRLDATVNATVLTTLSAPFADADTQLAWRIALVVSCAATLVG